MEGCGLAVVSVACCCGAEICAAVASIVVVVGMAWNGAGLSTCFAVTIRGTAVVVSLGTTIDIWLDSGSRFSSGSRDSRFLAKTCGAGACGLAETSTVCASGMGFCTVMVSASIGIAVTICNGMAMTCCGWARFCSGSKTSSGSRFSRLLTVACGMACCGLAMVSVTCGCGAEI